MTRPQFTFAAVFGGRDAAAAARPHLQALKRAAKVVSGDGISIGYVLHVDGEVQGFGFQGARDVRRISKTGPDRGYDCALYVAGASASSLRDAIASALRESASLIAAAWVTSLGGALDRTTLESAISDLIAAYEGEPTR